MKKRTVWVILVLLILLFAFAVPPIPFASASPRSHPFAIPGEFVNLADT